MNLTNSSPSDLSGGSMLLLHGAERGRRGEGGSAVIRFERFQGVSKFADLPDRSIDARLWAHAEANDAKL